MVDPVVEQLLNIMQATGLSYGEVAIACSASPSTLRALVQTRSMPATADARAKVAAFVSRNREATSRADIRFVP